MQPDNQSNIFNSHNIDSIASRAISEQEQLKVRTGILEAIKTPDKVSTERVMSLVDVHDNNLELTKLGYELSFGYRNGIAADIRDDPSDGMSSTLRYKARALLFRPYEVASHDDYPGIQFLSSVVAFAPKQSKEDEDSKAVLLFTLDATDTEQSDDYTGVLPGRLEMSDNCRFGVIVQPEKTQFFEICSATDKEETYQEMRRKDVTEESGESVDARVVKTRKAREGDIEIVEIKEGSDKAVELQQELAKFLESRQEFGQSDA